MSQCQRTRGFLACLTVISYSPFGIDLVQLLHFFFFIRNKGTKKEMLKIQRVWTHRQDDWLFIDWLSTEAYLSQGLLLPVTHQRLFKHDEYEPAAQQNNIPMHHSIEFHPRFLRLRGNSPPCYKDKLLHSVNGIYLR